MSKTSRSRHHAGIDPLTASATQLAAAIRTGALKPTEVLEAHIARIEQVNPHINGLVAQRFDLARAEARAAEARLAKATPNETLPPLLGVPCTIKELFGVKGLPNTGGLVSRRFAVADQDAEAVRRLRAAGAIVMGVSNVPEGGMWMETYNNVYGRTNNPWDVRRTSGGSSGGEAALIASGASPFGLASDVGGSIRIPSAFCGVVGHKPSGRLVPNTGCWPGFDSELSAYLSTGPMCRRTEDLWPLLQILAGPDGVDGVVKPWKLGHPDDVDIKDVVVYPWRVGHLSIVRAPMRQAMQDSLDALAKAGARIETRPLPSLRRSVAIWGAMITAAPRVSYTSMLSQGKPLQLWREFLKLPLRRTPHTSVALVTSVVETLFTRVTAHGALHQKLTQAGRCPAGRTGDHAGPQWCPNFSALQPPGPRAPRPHADPFGLRVVGPVQRDGVSRDQRAGGLHPARLAPGGAGGSPPRQRPSDHCGVARAGARLRRLALRRAPAFADQEHLGTKSHAEVWQQAGQGQLIVPIRFLTNDSGHAPWQPAVKF